jgi:hypothetical protein
MAHLGGGSHMALTSSENEIISLSELSHVALLVVACGSPSLPVLGVSIANEYI